MSHFDLYFSPVVSQFIFLLFCCTFAHVGHFEKKMILPLKMRNVTQNVCFSKKTNVFLFLTCLKNKISSQFILQNVCAPLDTLVQFYNFAKNFQEFHPTYCGLLKNKTKPIISFFIKGVP